MKEYLLKRVDETRIRIKKESPQILWYFDQRKKNLDKRNADIGEYESLLKEFEYDPIYIIISYECVSKIYDDTICMRLKNHIEKKGVFLKLDVLSSPIKRVIITDKKRNHLWYRTITGKLLGKKSVVRALTYLLLTEDNFYLCSNITSSLSCALFPSDDDCMICPIIDTMI